MNLTVAAVSVIGPWGADPAGLARWLADPDVAGPDVTLPNVPGFIASPFLNLACAAHAECLAAPGGAATRTGLVLASVLGDTDTADRASKAVAAGRSPQPLLFYQSVPSAVFGRITVEHPVDGPLVCLSGGPELCGDALEVADLMLGEDEVDRVLVTYVDAGGGGWRSAAAVALERLWGEPVVPAWDCAVAVLLSRRGACGPVAAPGAARRLPRPLRDFLHLAATGRPPGTGDLSVGGDSA